MSVTRLKLNMDTGEATFGSGDPQTPKGSGDFTDAEIAAAKPLTFQQFTDLTRDPRYSNSMDPRAAEKFRREAEAGLIRGQQLADMGRALEAPTDLVGRIVELNPGMPRELAQAAVQVGGYINMEHQVKGQREAAAQNSDNAMSLHEARVTLSMLEGR
jgi:hypothetical protein